MSLTKEKVEVADVLRSLVPRDSDVQSDCQDDLRRFG